MSPEPEKRKKSRREHKMSRDVTEITDCIISRLKAREILSARKPTEKQIEKITKKCTGVPTTRTEDKEDKLFL